MRVQAVQIEHEEWQYPTVVAVPDRAWGERLAVECRRYSQDCGLGWDVTVIEIPFATTMLGIVSQTRGGASAAQVGMRV